VGGSIVRDVGGRVRHGVLVVGIFIRFGKCEGEWGGTWSLLGERGRTTVFNAIYR
jgi:hypothetical protein